VCNLSLRAHDDDDDDDDDGDNHTHNHSVMVGFNDFEYRKLTK